MRHESQNFAAAAAAALAERRGAGRAGGWLDRELGGERRLSRRAGHQLPDVAPDCSLKRRRQAGAREFLQRDRPLSAGHRRRPYREAGRRWACRDDRPRDRPRAHLRRARRDHRAAGRGGGVRSGRHRSPAALDPRHQPFPAPLDRALGHSSRRRRHDLYLGRRRLHRRDRHSFAEDFHVAILHRRGRCRCGGAASVVVTLGDSITDGYRSKVDGNHRWPDRWRSGWPPVRAPRRSAWSTRASAATASSTIIRRTCSAPALWPGLTATCSRFPDSSGWC